MGNGLDMATPYLLWGQIGLVFKPLVHVLNSHSARNVYLTWQPGIYSSVRLVLFIAMVINSTAGMEHKSQKIEVVVADAEKYLGV